MRAALEELARTAGHALEGLVGDDWGRRYGRPVRLGKNPTRPRTRINEAGADARRRDDEAGVGLPPSAARIVSTYDLAARYSRRGQVTRRTGYLAHVTETCAEDGPNVITDVATMPATASTSKTPPGTSATPCGPASREPSASSPAATACATAATEDSPKPTCSTS